MAATGGGPVTLVKLGGSLITEKSTGGAVRAEVLGALAADVARAMGAGHRLVLGHGSGSFGHPAARRAGLRGGVARHVPALDVARVQAAAADLHRRVVEALLEAGAPAFSIPPSAAAPATRGHPGALPLEVLEAALAAGLLPVVYGDVALEPGGGALIRSTERILTSVAVGLRRRGVQVRRALWLGDVAGLLDGAGAVVARVSPRAADGALSLAGAAEGADVTGGMAHRLETALELAALGVPSWMGDGRLPGVVGRLLDDDFVPGTIVEGVGT